MAAPLKSYIDRILNVLTEIDDKGSDKKEIYKELAADGYDRTVVSHVVGHLRKKAAKPGKFAEQSQLFDLYLADYDGVGTAVATHTLHASRAPLPDHDAETGEILDHHEFPSGSAETSIIEGSSLRAPGDASDNSPSRSEPLSPPRVAAQEAAGAGDAFLSAAGDTRSSGRTESFEDGQQIHESPSINDEASSTAAPQGEAVHSQGTGAETLAGREGRSTGQAASAGLPANSPEAATDKPAGASAPAAPIFGMSSPDAPTPAQKHFILALRPHCQNLDACGGMGRNHCNSCKRLAREAGEEAA